MRQPGGRLFPVPAVEWRNIHLADGLRIDAAHVDAVAVRIRTRHIERLDAAHPAEKMPGDSGVERISRKKLRALNQGEARLGHDKMEIAALAAHRAVALARLDFRGRLDFKAHAPAVATSRMPGHNSACRKQTSGRRFQLLGIAAGARSAVHFRAMVEY